MSSVSSVEALFSSPSSSDEEESDFSPAARLAALRFSSAFSFSDLKYLSTTVHVHKNPTVDNEWTIQFSFYLYWPILFALLPLPRGLPYSMPLLVPCHVGIQVCHQDNSRFLC